MFKFLKDVENEYGLSAWAFLVGPWAAVIGLLIRLYAA